MTYMTAPTVFVRCDSIRHIGDPISKVESGPAITPNYALQRLGWHYNGVTQGHICPACWKAGARFN